MVGFWWIKGGIGEERLRSFYATVTEKGICRRRVPLRKEVAAPSTDSSRAAKSYHESFPRFEPLDTTEIMYWNLLLVDCLPGSADEK